MFVVRICSQNVHFNLTEFPTREEAEDFCDSLDWSYTDANDFVWDLDVSDFGEE